MEAGLNVLKFSLDAMDDDAILKTIRGKKANYEESIRKIHELLEIKKERGFQNITSALHDCNSIMTTRVIQNFMNKFLNFWKGQRCLSLILKVKITDGYFEQSDKDA